MISQRLNFDYAKFNKDGSSLYSKIPVVKMMVKMYKEYREENKTTDEDDFKIETRVDPVLRFVKYVLENSNLDNFNSLPDEETKLGIIRYITAAFYSFKGTAAVFQGLTKYLGIDFADSVVYTQQSLDFKLDPDSVAWVNEEERFIKQFNDFLYELLFLGRGDILDNTETYGVNAITMEINDTVEIRTSASIDLYRYHIAINNNGN